MKMHSPPLARSLSFFTVFLTFLMTATPLHAQAPPAWYTANVGGFVGYVPANGGNPAVAPTIPDFYQHQDWAPQGNPVTSSNAWESNPLGAGGNPSGWCGFTAFADVFYDLTARGYGNLFSINPVTLPNTNGNPNTWFTAMYGPTVNPPAPGPAVRVGNTETTAGVQQSDIYQLARAGVGVGNIPVSVQNYLNNTANMNRPRGLPALRSETYPVSPNGQMQYWSFPQRRFLPMAGANSSVFGFTNTQLRQGTDVIYELLPPNPPGIPPGSVLPGIQNPWWPDHALAVTGINLANNNVQNQMVYVADPDSNRGATGAGSIAWTPNNFAAPGNIASLPADGLPVPATPAFNNNGAGAYTTYYDGLSVSAPNLAAGFHPARITSTDAPQFNNDVMNTVSVIGANVVNGYRAQARNRPSVSTPQSGSANPAVSLPQEYETDITLQIPSDMGAVDGVIIEPSMPVVAPSSDPTADSLIDDNNSASLWTDTEDSQDPFGNDLGGNAMEYDLSSGNPLEPGEQAEVDIATMGDFGSLGYDVLLHFQGDPAGDWVPEQVAGSDYDPSDVFAAEDVVVPEPTALSLLTVFGLALAGRRRFRADHRAAMASAVRYSSGNGNATM
jgi:hypothetical protein